MFDIRLQELRPYAFEGNFGLERESLRVTEAGRMAQTPHPFPPDHPRIVRDFCENQTEINTGVHPTAEAAVAELKEVDALIRAAILPRGERLWSRQQGGLGQPADSSPHLHLNTARQALHGRVQ